MKKRSKESDETSASEEIPLKTENIDEDYVSKSKKAGKI